jgi:hypothetical protein
VCETTEIMAIESEKYWGRKMGQEHLRQMMDFPKNCVTMKGMYEPKGGVKKGIKTPTHKIKEEKIRE